MQGTKVKALYVVIGIAAVLLYAAAAPACQVDQYYDTKDNVLAAAAPETLNRAIKLDEQGKKDELEGLIKGGTVRRLAGNTKVRALEWSFEFKAVKVRLPGTDATWWVGGDALKQIDCKQ